LITELEDIGGLEIRHQRNGVDRSASRNKIRIVIGTAIASLTMLAMIVVSLNRRAGALAVKVNRTDAKSVTSKSLSRVDTKKQLAFESPEFDQWVKDVSELPAEKQLEEVSKKLVELNPGFDGKLTGLPGAPVIEKGVVTSVLFSTKNVVDISPVRAFVGLKQLIAEALNAGSGQSRLSDLSPLKGMELQSVNCLHTLVSDLSPLQGMAMTQLSFSDTNVSDISPLKGMPFECLCFWGTKVSDLSPLQGMKLTKLDFSSTPVTDLSALNGMPLRELFFSWTGVSDVSPLEGMPLEFVLLSPENITNGIDVIRQMKNLKTIGISWDKRYTPDEFWQKYDAGEFKKATP
jgi:Leucine-rich repeat (LRR) protein